VRRVVITGAGTVNPLAKDVQGTWTAMTEGRCSIGPLQIRDVERLSIRIGAAVQDWQSPHATLDRSVQFALEAARQAVEGAGLEFSGPLGLAAAECISRGTTIGCTRDFPSA
jgi:nodulation protein E